MALVAAQQSEGDWVARLLQRLPNWLGRIAPALAAFIVSTLYLQLYRPEMIWFDVPDAAQYRAMAAGQMNVVQRPFAFRMLAPWIVAHLMQGCHLSLPAAFLLLGTVCCWLFLFFVLLPLLRTTTGWLFALAILMTPIPLILYGGLYLPDVLHAGLLAFYLYLLRKRWWAAASVVILLLYLARESTILLAVIAILTLWVTRHRLPALMHLIATAIGMAISKSAGAHALPNRRGMGDLAYLIGKVPWNLAKNLFGRPLWVDGTEEPPPQGHIHHIPTWLPSGRSHSIGLGYADPTMPLYVFAFLLSLFGLGTLLAVLVFRRPWRQWWPAGDTALIVALIYGAVCFLLSIALGTGIARLIAYAWPLFFVFLPRILPRILPPLAPWRIAALLLLQLAITRLSTGESGRAYGLLSTPFFNLYPPCFFGVTVLLVALAAAILLIGTPKFPTYNPPHTAPESV